MKYLLPFLLIFPFSFSAIGQITGEVTNTMGEPLPYVNIYLEGGVSGTTTNEKGHYEMEISRSGNYTVVFQFLGYKTAKKKISVSSFPFVLNTELTEESTALDEVVLNPDENPALRIIRNAIENRTFHKEKIQAYTADFYSRGLWRIENAPEKILGQEVGDLGGGLDSTRSGIIYLSETISEITFQAPDDFKEKIIASKISGNDGGFSLNNARDFNISFYNNSISLNSELVSPIADYALNYYNYKLEGIFYDERGIRINKIQVIPKRPTDRVFHGYIYIMDNSWQIYGTELSTTGEAMQVPPIKELLFKQNFNFSEEVNLWVPISQVVEFEFGMVGIEGSGRFIAVYTNYDFTPELKKNSFGNEILSFAPDANEQDSLFWKNFRPVPLTPEERKDYIKKDSIQEYRSSAKYLDSIDRVQNEFNLLNLLTGYRYSNSFEKWSLDFSSPIFNTYINTVQGYNTALKISFRQDLGETYGEYWRIFTTMGYGFSEERYRISGGFQKQFNNVSKPVLTISGGSSTRQINDLEPISEAINSVTTNYFERNYLKLYELLFLKTAYQQELFNGFHAATSLSIEERSPLYNHWNSGWVNRDGIKYTSNNPLEPYNYDSAPFEEHRIFKFDLSASIRFDQKYLSYPDGKYNLPNPKYPMLLLFYEKGFGADITDYNFDHFRAGLLQKFSIQNKGEFIYSLSGGTFFNDETVSYLDLRHFDGNQTSIASSSSYVGRFNLLPYYALSTSGNYAEAHIEHDFEGYILGKVPLLNRLNFNLVVGAHRLMTEDTAPYSEYSVGLNNLGFGNFRFLRLDYIISDFNGNYEGGFIFGLKFLNML